MDGVHRSLQCGELAHLTGVSPDTIRNYERLGVLPEPPRTAGGYRMYGRDAISRVRLVRRALQLGFTLSELSEILKARDAGDIPCQRVLALTEKKLHSLVVQIKELQRTHRCMKQLVREWRAKVRGTQPGKPAMLLHSLVEKPSRNSVANFKRRKL